MGEAQDLASLAGFTVAFFNSNPELKRLFNQALAGNWTGERLLQAAQNTKWFKTTPTSARELLLLQTSDPATYNARVSEMRLHVTELAVEIGHSISGPARNALVALALRNGWNDSQIRSYMGRWNYVYKAATRGGTLGGQIGQVQQRLNQAQRDYGVRLAKKEIGTALQGIASGRSTEERAMERIRRVAMSAFPGLKDEIQGGITVRDYAESYIQSMAKLWEKNPEDIDLFDTTLRGALSVKGKDGKFSAMALPEFETKLRKSKQWLRTDNAQDDVASNAHGILQSFGVVS